MRILPIDEYISVVPVSSNELALLVMSVKGQTG